MPEDRDGDPDAGRPTSNVLNTIRPYWDGATWVFDDPQRGLVQEPFVAGTPEIIDRALDEAGLPPRQPFSVIFSNREFPGPQIVLERCARRPAGTGTAGAAWRDGCARRCSGISMPRPSASTARSSEPGNSRGTQRRRASVTELTSPWRDLGPPIMCSILNCNRKCRGDAWSIASMPARGRGGSGRCSTRVSSGLLPAGRSLNPDTLAAAVSGLFRSLTRRSFGVFPGVDWALAHLQPRYRLALVSNAQRVLAESELAATGLDRFFPVRVLSAVVGIKKPDSRIFSAALHALGGEPAGAVYVGDNPKDDLVGARSAGMRCIIFGADGIEYDGLRPDACFRNHGDLPALLDRLWG